MRKYVFMFRRFYLDLFKPSPVPEISKDLYSSRLREYYLLFREESGLNRLITKFDENGVPLNSAYIDVELPRLHYYPISIGQYGLAVFHSWLQSGSEEKKNHFLRIANWFMENKVLDERLGAFWLTDIPKPEYLVNDPWKSAFSQSRAISILLRAWQLTGEVNYLRTATLALRPYTFDIADGGVAAYLREGRPFYEEYVASQPTMVLDGHIFSLLGLMDYIRAVPEVLDRENHHLARQLFNQGAESLLQWLPEFNMGYWLRFNLCKMPQYPANDPCTLGYFRLVLLQLDLMHRLSREQEFILWNEKLSKFDKPLNILRMYFVKYKALRKLKRL